MLVVPDLRAALPVRPSQSPHPVQRFPYTLSGWAGIQDGRPVQKVAQSVLPMDRIDTHQGPTHREVTLYWCRACLSVVRELEKGAWPRVVSEAVTSGELKETGLGLASVLNERSPTPDEAITDDSISQP